MTITLAAVYTPVGIQGGLTGALFREFAFTLAGAVIVSGVVALTLSPMMGSKLLRAGRHRARLRRLDQPPLRRRPPGATRGLLRDAALPSGGPHAVDNRRRC
jgi:multidrug efflux pump